MTRLTAVAALPLALVIALPLHAQDSSPDLPDSAYVPGAYRVYTGAGAPASLDDVVTAMAPHHVVFIGETHDDPTGHMLEAELLRLVYEAYGEQRPIALSLEFFQRDVQSILDEYLSGLIQEKSFRADSRPWPRYETDYRPLIEFAKQNILPVIAANAPRRYASRVTEHGRESLSDLSVGARDHLPPLPYGEASEAYRDQWVRTIMEVTEEEGLKCGLPIPEPEEGEEAIEPRAPVGSHAAMGNQLHSQVLWDASMAYWIARFLMEQPNALVLHMVGGFHVERGTGTPEHLESYRPGTSRMIISLRPVDDVETFEPAPEGEWGDFVIQTDKSHTLEEIECRAYLAELDGQ
jgi:uncharacterized iron-regulated protein